MFSSRGKNKPVNAPYEHQIVSLISGNLLDLEEKILAQLSSKKIDKYELTVHGKDYKKELLVTAGKLTKISSVCFQNTEIDNVKIYKNDLLVPKDYKNYLQVLGNLTKLVTDDISNQHDVKHAILHLERWIYISKICFERNDYFTAGAIMCTLFSVNDNLVNSVSDIAKSIFWYYKQLYTRQNKLHILQFRQSVAGKNVIPLLSTLANSLSNAEVSAEADAEEEANEKDLSPDEYKTLLKGKLETVSNDCKKIYIIMKQKMGENDKKSTIENGSLEEKFFFCLHEDLVLSKANQKDSKKIDINEIIGSIYENEDWFYCHVERMDKLQNDFNSIDTNKFEQNDKDIHDRIKGILGQNDISNPAKLKLISKVMEVNTDINKKFLKKCIEILDVLKKLSQLNLKRISLEPKVSHKVKITSNKESSKKRTSSDNFKVEAAMERRIHSAPSILKRSLTNTNGYYKKSKPINVTIKPKTNSDDIITNNENKNISINLTINIENNSPEKEPVEINVKVSEFNQGFFNHNQSRESKQPKKIYRSRSHVPKEMTKPQTSYTSSQLPGLLFIDDEQRVSRIRREPFQNELRLGRK